jgi:hypothetical protein
MLTILFWLSLSLIMALVGLPMWRFIFNGWNRRKHEFSNRLNGDCFDRYRTHFWGGEKPSFNRVYNSIAGRRLYVVPVFLLAVTLFLLGGLVTETSIRAGYEQYFHYYRGIVSPEFADKLGLAHASIAQLQGVFYPFDDIVLDFASVASVGGAYLYTVGVVIQGFRTRSLTPTDLIWCSFRLVIAIPLGLCLALLPPAGVGAFLAFALGAFPIDALNRLLRRVVNMQLKTNEEQEITDRVVYLAGVTPDIAALLNAEGVQAVQQLATLDPVSLAIRTGLSFDFMLNLVAQSQAWCFLGDKTKCLQDMGLGDARPIADIVRRMEQHGEDDPMVVAIMTAASGKTGIDPSALKFLFRRIAGDEYTQFLVHFGCRHPIVAIHHHHTPSPAHASA